MRDRRAHPADLDPRRQGHLGHGPAAERLGPTLIVLAEFKDPVYDLSGIRLITSSVRRHAPDSLDPKIHHNNLLTSILAKIEANVAGADDAVMLDSRGFIAETNATHLFMVLPRDLALRAVPARARCWRRRRRWPARRGSPGRPCCGWPRPPGSPALEGDYTPPAALQRGRGLRHRHDGRPGPGGVRGRAVDRRRRGSARSPSSSPSSTPTSPPPPAPQWRDVSDVKRSRDHRGHFRHHRDVPKCPTISSSAWRLPGTGAAILPSSRRRTSSASSMRAGSWVPPGP